MARTATALFLLALLLCAPLASAVDGRAADVIDADQTLTEDTTYNDGFTVTNGATFTVQADLTLGEDKRTLVYFPRDGDFTGDFEKTLGA